MTRLAMLAAGALVVGAGWASAVNPPFGGDDTGFIPPPKSALAKCETKVAKATAKLVAGIIKCHVDRAAGKKIVDEVGEDACEQAAKDKFVMKTSIVGCDACTDLPNLGALVEAAIDGANGLVFCASSSPSSAFFEKDRGYLESLF